MTDNILEVTRSQILADIAEALKPFEPPAEWVTAREMATEWGWTFKQAQYRLDTLTDKGKVIKHKNGRHVFYEVVSDDPD